MNKVSIIIPVYNAEHTLRKCVESIVYGEEKDIEIILVEDNSSDNSWEECLNLQKEFSQVVCKKNKHNKGVSYSRNQGLKEASGEYVLFVDSDDWVSGRYVKHMLTAAVENQDSFIICGYMFVEKLFSRQTVMLFSDEINENLILAKAEFFDLISKIHLQQLWNKIFRRDIIEQHQICFDESQSMGEDFQFVLDYMEASQVKQSIILNRVLYYYVRANETSLMSKFGLEKHEREFERFHQLLRICGTDDLNIQKKYIDTIENAKRNFIYQIGHSNASKQEKLTAIEQVMKDGKAAEYYIQQQNLIIKEKVVCLWGKCRVLPNRVIGKLKREIRDYKALKQRKLLKNNDFTIISQNCIGGVFYFDMGMKFLSPTINLYFKAYEFVKFVENLEYYIKQELKIRWEEDYPVGQLDDITIYFMHYDTCNDAREAWERRKKRINWKKIVIVSTDMEGFDDNTWIMWEKIKYPKVLFSAKERKSQGVVCFPQYKEMGHVLDLLSDRDFYKNGVLMDVINNL